MIVPKLHDKVIIRERAGIFFVVGIDEERGTVDVVSASGMGSVEEDIALDTVRLLSDIEWRFAFHDRVGSRTDE
ncbi:MAG: hypothetical protein RB191_10330 [Terriglobia bacterium]|nr:hypothetical protein [Terriglobia bacterium]